MSLLDDWLAKLRGKATEEAGKAAVKASGEAGKAAVGAAAATAQKAVSGFAEDFLSFAEGELADARASRGLEEGEEAEGVVPDQDEAAPEDVEAAAEAAPTLSARERREAREAKAREELARLKAMMGKDDDAS